MVEGLLRILVCTAFLAIVLGSVFYSREIAASGLWVGRRLRLVASPAPARMGRPLERIVRDLRRLQPEARRHRQGVTLAKHRGVMAAYDDLLLEACRAVEVPTSLDSWPEGLERESERLRIEYELERAGIPIRTAS